jgi:hypothetical protein
VSHPPSLPRPTFYRVDHDLEVLLEPANRELKYAQTALQRTQIVKRYLLEAYEAGVTAQRELAVEWLKR